MHDAGGQPHDGLAVADVFNGMLDGSLRPKIPVHPQPSSGWQALMEACWATDPAARPSFEEVVDILESMYMQVSEKKSIGCEDYR